MFWSKREFEQSWSENRKLFKKRDIVLEGVDEFKYLGDELNNGGGCMRAVMGRARAAWGSFKESRGA